MAGAERARAAHVPTDPVKRCAGVLRAIPPLTDAAAKAERIEPVERNGCRFTSMTSESGEKKILIGLILAELLDFERTYDGRLPDAVTLHVEDIVLGGDGLPPGVDPSISPSTAISTPGSRFSFCVS